MGKFRRYSEEEMELRFSSYEPPPPFGFVDSPIPRFIPQEGLNSVRFLPPRLNEEYTGHLGASLDISYIDREPVLSPTTRNTHPYNPAAHPVEGETDLEAEIRSRCMPEQYRLKFVMDLADCRAKYLLMASHIKEELLTLTIHPKTFLRLDYDNFCEGDAIYFWKSEEDGRTRLTRFWRTYEDYPIDRHIVQSLPLIRDILIIPTPDEFEAKIKAFQAKEIARIQEAEQRPDRDIRASLHFPEPIEGSK